MSRKLQAWIRNTFGFTKTETNGTIILFGIMLVLVMVPFMIDDLLPGKNYLSTNDQKVLDSLTGLIEFVNPTSVNSIEIPPDLFRFNPNDISKSDLVRLGLQESVALRLIKYREAGGNFRIKKDLLKIYGFSEAEYDQLKSYIDLPDRLPDKKPYNEKELTKKPVEFKSVSANPVVLLDINQADTSDLVAIKGIGKVLATRIIKFRELLGGFTSIQQLEEIYGLPDETVKILQESAYINQDYKPTQININFANRSELLKHPYIDPELAKKLIEFRDKNGPFKSTDALRDASIMADSLFNKLQPYVTL